MRREEAGPEQVAGLSFALVSPAVRFGLVSKLSFSTTPCLPPVLQKCLPSGVHDRPLALGGRVE